MYNRNDGIQIVRVHLIYNNMKNTVYYTSDDIHENMFSGLDDIVGQLGTLHVQCFQTYSSICFLVG